MPWRAGMIGIGRVSEAHLRALKHLPDVELAAAFDKNHSKATHAVRRFGGLACRDVDALLEIDLDLVIICVPTFVHRDYVVKAASSGKHILCEKPMALTLEEADEMIAVCRSSGVKLMVGHVLRFYPELKKLHELIKAEDYGKLLQLHSERLSGLAGQSWDRWLFREDRSLGAIDIHIHDLDFTLWTLGPPISVTSMGARRDGENVAHISTLMDYGDGLHVSLEASFMLPESYGFSFTTRAIFEGAAVEYRFQGARYDKPSHTSFMIYRPDGIDVISVKASDPYQNELQYFLSCIKDDRTPELASGEEGRNALALAMDVRHSLKTGGPVIRPKGGRH